MEGEHQYGAAAMIDTRQPFSSVKEAVLLFGERVLAPQIHANKLIQIKRGEGGNENGHDGKIRNAGAISDELKAAKKSVEKAKAENNLMAYCIRSVREELDQSKTELHTLKGAAEFHNQQVDDDYDHNSNNPVHEIMEDIKLIEKTHDKQKKRSVSFASPTSMAQVIMSRDELVAAETTTSTSTSTTSVKSAKKKTSLFFIQPLLSCLLSRN